MKSKGLHYFIVGTFLSLYILVSLISCIHSVDFFMMSNSTKWLAITLAIGFELGAAASLASIVVLDKTNKFIVWSLFVVLTAFQCQANAFSAYIYLHDFQGWIELFGLNEEELIFQKRVLSIVAGAILPIIALGFIKSLVDYIKPSEEVIPIKGDDTKEEIINNVIETNSIEKNLDLIETTKKEMVKDILDEYQEVLEEESSNKKLPEDFEAVNLNTPIGGNNPIEELQSQDDIIVEEVAPEESKIEEPIVEENSKKKEIERKIKTILNENPELKESLGNKIKELEDKNKYIEQTNEPAKFPRRTYGGI